MNSNQISEHLHASSSSTSDAKIILKAKENLKNLSFTTNFLEIIKTFSLLSLPHVSILVIYLIYIFIGAAIIQEIEETPLRPSQANHQLNHESLMTFLNNYEKNLIISLDKITDDNEDNGREQLNEIQRAQAAQFQIADEKIDLETLKLITKLIKLEKKFSTDSDEFYRKLIKYFLNYKQELRQNFNSNFINIIHNEKLNLEKQIKPQNNGEDIVVPSIADNGEQQHVWSFRKSLYFVSTLLTTIGYGDLAPQTKLGKLFTIAYAFIGIPLTLILLNDLGCLFTRYLKFWRIFLLTLYNNGYFDTWIIFIKSKSILKKIMNLRRRSLLLTNVATSSSPNTSHTSSRSSRFRFFRFPFNNNKSTNYTPTSTTTTVTTATATTPIYDSQPHDESSIIKTSDVSTISIDSFESFMDVAINCYEHTNDTFDFSFSVLLVFIFGYLTFGAILYSNYAEWSLLDGYYYCFVTLTLIGFGDLVINDPTFWLMTVWYTFFGLAFFMLVIQWFHNLIKKSLIRNGKKLISDILKFANQLGYKFDIDDTLDDENFSKTNTSSSLQSQSSGNSASYDTSSEKFNASSDDLFVNSNNTDNYNRQQYQQQLQRQNSVRRRSSLFHKRTSILKDLNEFKNLNKDNEIFKCDKQTQITTLLCTTYMTNTSGNSVTSQQTAIVKPNKIIKPTHISLEPIEETTAPALTLKLNDLPVDLNKIIEPQNIAVSASSSKIQ